MAISVAKDTIVQKNAPGSSRKPGTKDYALILSSLMTRRNALIRNKDNNEEEVTEIIVIISQKLQELGFNKPAEILKNIVKRRVNTSYKWRDDRFENIDQKKATTLEYAEEYWTKGKEKHLKIKNKSTR